jgi:hypothetical protein
MTHPIRARILSDLTIYNVLFLNHFITHKHLEPHI